MEKGYYVYVEDEGDVYIETVDENGVPTLVLDTETDQQLMMDYITKKDMEKYSVQPEEQEDRDEMETISSMSMADYDCEEVETSLTAIADAFHKIGNEYEHLCSIVLHMSKAQMANVISRLPIIPCMGKNMPVKTETKMEPGKSESVATTVPMATTSVQISVSEAMTSTKQERITETLATPKTPPVVELDTVPKEKINVEKDAQASRETREAGVETEESETRPEKTELYNRYELSGKGETSEQKVNKGIKDINYHNMVAVIVIGDKIINNIGGIRAVAEKWGLSFGVVQRALSGIKEHWQGE